MRMTTLALAGGQGKSLTSTRPTRGLPGSSAVISGTRTIFGTLLLACVENATPMRAPKTRAAFVVIVMLDLRQWLKPARSRDGHAGHKSVWEGCDVS